ncbi:hypothetical protein PILCRDRAFT_93461 [Piloderma croceum F 1598]|uniref:Uncharacterized protein n=1 Tax=Piloderma croceum (strain F 1598) TaxID=765440 RepID=A0A0C3EIK2_PILCF|nr:hypothetical protein PILCRDRAFT_93461 [Piloderma croceum F 1598]
MPSTLATTRTGSPSITQLDAPSFIAPASVADGIRECDPTMKTLQKTEQYLQLIRSVIEIIIASEAAAAAPLYHGENDVISPDSKAVVVDEIETTSENKMVQEKREGNKVKDMGRVVVLQATNGSESTGPSNERQEISAHRPCAAVRHPLPLVEDREDAHPAVIEPLSEDVFNEDEQWPRPNVRARPPPAAKQRIQADGPIVRQRSRSVDSARTLAVFKQSPHGLPAAPTDRMAVSGPLNRKTLEIDRVPPPLPSTPPPTRLIRKATSMGSGLNRTRRRSKSASHKNTPHGVRNDAMTPQSQRSEDTSGNDQSSHN